MGTPFSAPQVVCGGLTELLAEAQKDTPMVWTAKEETEYFPYKVHLTLILHAPSTCTESRETGKC